MTEENTEIAATDEVETTEAANAVEAGTPNAETENAGTAETPSSELPTKAEVETAKKELGIGGGAFCDELLTAVPDAFARLRASGKTLHGLYNFAYSLALKEYLAVNGKKDGGGWWDTRRMLETYLDDSVKEGFTYGEPAVKSASSGGARKAAKASAKTKIEKVAKAAASNAKKAAEARETEKPEKKTPEQIADEKHARLLELLAKLKGAK